MKLKSIAKKILVASFISLTLSGCTPSISSETCTVYGANQACRTVKGVITNCRLVKVEGCDPVAGTVTGGLAGAIAGSAIGAGRGSVLAAIGGGLIGAGVGGAMERTLSRQWGMEYVIRTNYGDYLTIVQAPRPAFQRGQHVLVVLGPRARVIADQDYCIG